MPNVATKLVAAALLGLAAAPVSTAAQTVISVNGFAEFKGVFFPAGLWTTVDTGTIVAAAAYHGSFNSQYWWEDWSWANNGNYNPVLVGNDYFDSYSCSVVPDAPHCLMPFYGQTLTLYHNSVLHTDPGDPVGFDNCVPFNGVYYQICAIHYHSFWTDHYLKVAAPDGTAVTLAFSPEPNPVPEPAVWTLLIAGFGLVGVAQRLAIWRRHRAAA